MFLALLVPAVASAQPQPPALSPPAAARPQPSAEVLLTALKRAGSPEAARAIEGQLDNLWSSSGSPSADLLLQRAEDAADDGDFNTAAQILAKLTAVAPNFAEAWHQRAEIAAERKDFHDAMASLQRALVLEPRHFGALTELGTILEEFGDKEHALEAYRKALALDPFLQDVPDRIRALSKELEGQSI